MIHFAEEFKLNIILRYYNGEKIVTNNIKHGERTIKIFLIRWKNNFHYVPDEKVPLTTYFIKHYEEILNYCNENGKDIEKFFNVTKKEGEIYKHSLNNYIPVYKCLSLLRDAGAIKEIVGNDMIKKKYYDSFLFSPENISLTYEESKLIVEDKKSETTNTLLFADFECFTSSDYHKPYCIIVMNEVGAWKKFYGMNCADKFINYLQTIESPLCYFHNLGYDGRFLAKYGIINIVKKGKMIYKMTIKLNGKKIVFKDTLALIPTSISNFKTFFKLDGNYEKEIFPYNYYNEETMNIGVIENCWNKETPSWSLEKIAQFKENLIKNRCMINETEFNAEKYCEYYCLRNVLVLREGFLKYKKMMKENLNLECTQFSTLSSLSYYYFKNNCFVKDFLFEYTGNVREYIKKSVYSGRNMLGENKKHMVNKEIVDFDACSLYPSAVARLFLPSGAPRVMNKPLQWYLEHLMEEQQYETTQERFISYFIVTIEITKVNKKRKMPIIIKKVNGINQYVNEPTIMTVDSIYLEDLLKYQEIEFNVKEGIYWDGGKASLFKEKIKEIYDIRKQKKAEHDPSEVIFKLIMNSCYGKTIQKPIMEENKLFRTKRKMLSYWKRNLEDILSGEQIYDSDIWILNVKKQLDEFFVPNIIGVLILSMSKRIMNELIYLCEDNNIYVYYQDTDSIHIEKDKLAQLRDSYYRKYNRELVGNNIGQFHSDFPSVNGKESWSIKSIFLGKKSYLDVLTNEDGDIDYLIRMKGIPKDVIIGVANEKFEGDVVALYEYLYAGYPLTFDLSKYGPHFVIERDFRVRTLDEFKRTIKF
ncbi:DNA polymerase, putative [Entamoeba histolytica HM-1:IMSS]|uniref:DNA-directed DNA polymerase n=1 Tax=Entamoeba histolytica (strain ATCC 30459 / HM-1:IMSS / ABRM) TaxID=294381 RepID=B1N526_ENTH1|nr:DNA polymerase, putative [Entamoeba histolytica HM-1:IMSS]EDS88927.1 DNA polymerase, putative [Entamoeba histolytica HM-1:IMSS]|eukprot:XP_001914292.1 DNA polymerase, putative [Entamoeba histolytica HM-1:IMSS]